MRNLTELLQEIPLDEMTEGLEMKNKEKNSIIMPETNTTAKIKSKAPLAAAIAACAVIAVMGAVHFLGGNGVKTAPNAKDNSGVTTSAADTSAADVTNEKTVAEDISVYSENEQFARLMYDSDEEFELVKDNMRIMDEKIGTVEKGFENLDIRVVDVICNYPYYVVDVGIQTKDGSEIPDEVTEWNKVMFSEIFSNDEFSLNISYAPRKFGDKAIYRLIASPNCVIRDNDQGYIDENSDISVKIAPCSGEDGDDLFTASFKAGEIFGKDQTSEGNYMLETSQDGHCYLCDVSRPDRFKDNEKTEYTVNGISYSNCGVKVNVTFKNVVARLGNTDALNVILSDEDIMSLKLKDSDERINLIKDTDFIQNLVSSNNGEAGTVEGSSYDVGTERIYCEKERDGSFSFYWNLIDEPVDISKVESVKFGSAEIKIPENNTANETSSVKDKTSDKEKNSVKDTTSVKDNISVKDTPSVKNNISVKEPPSVKNNTSVEETPSVKNNTSVKDTPSAKAKNVSVGMSVYEENEQFARLAYDSDEAYELAKDNIVIMNEKVGEIKNGFDNLDIRIAAVSGAYPFYEIVLAVQTKDGSPITDGESLLIDADISVDGKILTIGNMMLNVFGDKAVNTQCITLEGRDYAANITEEKDIQVKINTIRKNLFYTKKEYIEKHPEMEERCRDIPDDGMISDREIAYYGLYEASFKPINLKNIPADARSKSDLSVRGKWNILNFWDDTDQTDDYTIDSINWSANGLSFGMKLDEDNDVDPFTIEAYLGSPQLEASSCNGGLEEEYFEGHEPFVKLEYADGTVKTLDVTDVTADRYENGSIAVYFNTMTVPTDYTNVTAIHLGTAVIPIK